MRDAAQQTSGLGDVSRWPLRADRGPERADVDRGHALICTGATARPGRDRKNGRRGASIQEQIVAVMVGCAPVITQLEFQQSFLFMFLEVPQIQFNFRVPDIPVVRRDGYAQRQTEQNTSQVQGMVVGSDSSSSSPSAWANCAENPSSLVWSLLAQRLVRQCIHVLRQLRGASGRTSPHFLREGGNSDPLVSGVGLRSVHSSDSVALPRWLHVEI